MANRPSKALIKKHHGNLKAAWAEHRRTHGAPMAKASRRRGGDSDGNPSSTNAGGALRASIPLHNVRKFDSERIGALLSGFVQTLQRPRSVDLTEYYPPVEGQDDDAQRQWNKLADERRIGQQMAEAFGYAILKHGVSEKDMVRWFREAVARVRVEQVGPGASGVGGGGFWPPLDIPTEVTSPFGAARAGGYHRGVDLAAPVGSFVHAPWNARVIAVDEDSKSGKFVKLALQRPDGGYAAETGMSDDSGIIMSFLHLSEHMVKQGETVLPGQVIGRSGNTGESTGPHLHIAAEYFVDAPFYSTESSNNRYFIDPLALYGGEDAVTGRGAAKPIVAGAPLEAIEFPRGQEGGGGNPLILNVTNNGAMAIGGSRATNVETRLKAVLPLASGEGEGAWDVGPMPDSASGGGGGFRLPLPPGLPAELRDMAMRATQGGGKVVEGLGNLAGRFFTRWTSPEGVSQLIELTGRGASLVANLVGMTAPVAGILAKPAAAIPYVGPFIGGALEIYGAVGTVVGPIAGAGFGAGAAVENAGRQGGVTPTQILAAFVERADPNFEGPPRPFPANPTFTSPIMTAK